MTPTSGGHNYNNFFKSQYNTYIHNFARKFFKDKLIFAQKLGKNDIFAGQSSGEKMGFGKSVSAHETKINALIL